MHKKCEQIDRSIYMENLLRGCADVHTEKTSHLSQQRIKDVLPSALSCQDAPLSRSLLGMQNTFIL